MKPLWLGKATSAMGFAALSFALFFGYAGNCAAKIFIPVGSRL
jgi:hypothetical protein